MSWRGRRSWSIFNESFWRRLVPRSSLSNGLHLFFVDRGCFTTVLLLDGSTRRDSMCLHELFEALVTTSLVRVEDDMTRSREEGRGSAEVEEWKKEKWKVREITHPQHAELFVRPGIHGHASYETDVNSQTSMNSRAFQTKKDTKRN
jgi:hypothetical protein